MLSRRAGLSATAGLSCFCIGYIYKKHGTYYHSIVRRKGAYAILRSVRDAGVDECVQEDKLSLG